MTRPGGFQPSNSSSDSKGTILKQTFTTTEEQRIQARLDQQLGPEFISARVGAGGAKLLYITAPVVINLANSIFGFNGWSSEVLRLDVDYMDTDSTGTRFNVGVSAVVRIILRDGTTRDDIGFGSAENMKQKGAAFDKARKQAVTDAYKRALKNFGNVLGLCLYDHDYLKNVSRVKMQQKTFDEKNLHRVNDNPAPPVAMVKRGTSPPSLKRKYEVNEPKICAEDNYEDFDDGDFDDSMLIDESTSAVIGLVPQIAAPKLAATAKPPAAANQSAQMQLNGTNGAQIPTVARPSLQTTPNPQMRPPNPAPQRMPSPERTPHSNNQVSAIPQDAPAAFYSARAITIKDDSPALNSNQNRQFNPHADSPSIRKTELVDHRVSGPVPKTLVTQPIITSHPKNVVNPQLDASRKIGVPNRTPGNSTFKPQIPATTVRLPLQETNTGNAVRTASEEANKRLKSE